MPKLNPTQRETLAAAADAADGMTDAPGASVYKPLIKAGLMMAIPNGETGLRLLITEAGRIKAGDGGAAAPRPADAPPTEPVPEAAAEPQGPPEKTAGPSGKLGALAALLERPEGATIAAMMQATGWLAHSVRGALSGGLKKKHGIEVTSAKIEGVRIYRLKAAEA